MKDAHRFRAKLARFRTKYGFDVPERVSRAIGVRGQVPVAVRLARGETFRATLVPSGGGRHRIFVNARTRAAAELALGDTCAIEIVVDDGDREVPIPVDLRDALREAGTLDTWQAFRPGKREHILEWIERAAFEATREKRIAQTVEITLAKREKRLDRS
jgi:hypothetical protein